jgi:hypothetical protein
MVDEIEYPLRPIDEMDISSFQTLKKNWEFSATTLEKISRKLSESLNDEEISIAVAGSFGRLEASQMSDLDFILLSQHKLENEGEVLKCIRQTADEFSIGSPNPAGVFSEIISVSNLVEKLGRRDDTLDCVAQRMLMLMETRPLYNQKVYQNVTDQILRKYLEYVIQDPKKEALFLMNDLIRYFRSICVNYQFHFWREQERWTLRNVKLRHSRIILFAGLLFLIMNASKERRDKFTYISSKIHLTPLEKIAFVYSDNEDHSFDKILGIYEVFLRKITDRSIRNTLQIDYGNRYSNPHYLELKVSADSLRTELTRFVFSMKGIWTEQVLEYLIF